ncbi:MULTISPECIES: hypothetical protein [Nostocales]|nr:MULTISPECIES: hypothetical protein [Nostocales]MBD2475964.1 hypothetical protein [Anabaena sp. FACHB-83]
MKHFDFSDSAEYMNIAQGVVGEGITNHRHFWETFAGVWRDRFATSTKQV